MARLHVRVQLDDDIKRKIDEGLKIAYSALHVLHQINEAIRLRKGEVSPGVFVSTFAVDQQGLYSDPNPVPPGIPQFPDASHIHPSVDIYWDTTRRMLMQRIDGVWVPCRPYPDDVPKRPRT